VNLIILWSFYTFRSIQQGGDPAYWFYCHPSISFSEESEVFFPGLTYRRNFRRSCRSFRRLVGFPEFFPGQIHPIRIGRFFVRPVDGIASLEFFPLQHFCAPGDPVGGFPERQWIPTIGLTASVLRVWVGRPFWRFQSTRCLRDCRKGVASAREVCRLNVSKLDGWSNEPLDSFFLPCHFISQPEGPISQTMIGNRGSEGLIPAPSLSSSQTNLAILGLFTRLGWNRRSCDLALMDVAANLETGFPIYILLCGLSLRSSRETTPPL